MSTQIAVRLPDEIVEFVDAQVAGGSVRSRADFIARAIRREQRRLAAERDAEIYSAEPPDEDLAALVAHTSRRSLDDLDQMRPIHLARLDKTRPVLVLTRDAVRGRLSTVTVAPITSRIWGVSTEIAVGPANGLDHACVVNLDSIVTIAETDLGRQIGRLRSDQELALTEAIHAAFDLA